MGSSEVIAIYSVWIWTSLDFCVVLLASLWIYRIWRRTQSSAYLCLCLGMGIFPFLLFLIRISINFLMPYGNITMMSLMAYPFKLCQLCSLAAILLGLLLLEKDRIPRREIIPAAIRNKFTSNTPDDSHSAMPASKKVAILILVGIAITALYSVNRMLDHHPVLKRDLIFYIKTCIVWPLMGFWLFRLYQLTHDKGHLWLLAAILAGPVYEIISASIMKAVSPPTPSAGSEIFYYINHFVATRILKLVCTVMALCTMAGGVVSFREVFFPSVKEAEESREK